jgi:hypothetical protein
MLRESSLEDSEKKNEDTINFELTDEQIEQLKLWSRQADYGIWNQQVTEPILYTTSATTNVEWMPTSSVCVSGFYHLSDWTSSSPRAGQSILWQMLEDTAMRDLVNNIPEPTLDPIFSV